MNVVFNCIDFLISIYILIIHLIEFYNQSQVERLVYGTWIKWLNQQNRVCECSNEVKSTAEFSMYIENVLKNTSSVKHSKLQYLKYNKVQRYFILLYRHECFTGKYTTRKIHKNYIRDPSGLFSIISHVSLSMT